MRSPWIARLFRHAHGTGQVLAQSPLNASVFSSRTAGKVRGVQADLMYVHASKSARLCMGIGDGRVHKQ